MKKLWLLSIGVALALILGIAGLVVAQTADNGGTTSPPGSVSVSIPNQQVGIWVNGLGKVTVVPDLGILQLGVEAQAGTVAEAQSQATAAMNAVMAALKANGIADKDIQTRYFSINKVTRWDKEGSTEIVVGYRVSNTVTVKVRALDKMGAVIDAVAEAGGDLTRINSISFTVEDPTTYEKEAREKAMADAKAKAEQLAALGGINLGKPTYISESNYSYPTPVYYEARDAAGMSSETPISAGEMDITVNIQVTYAIQQ
jgi:uncharacterized protein YggE